MLGRSIAIAATLVSASAALAQDAALGKLVFEDRCVVCHSAGEGTGSAPDLTGVIGRPAASLEGFAYGPAMIEAGQKGVVWDIETLSAFITKPRSVVNGSNMAFTGLRNPDDVANVIAYIATFSPPAQ
jgi:cytochrome c